MFVMVHCLFFSYLDTYIRYGVRIEVCHFQLYTNLFNFLILIVKPILLVLLN